MIRSYDREQLRQQFQLASPFPHILFEQFLEPDVAQALSSSYPTFDEAKALGFTFKAINEQNKVQVTDATRFPALVQKLNDALAAPAFLADLAYITGIPNLLADDRLAGGGMHITGPGGRLDVHVDFNFYEERQLHRRLNILLYLNPVWQPGWGGELEFWDADVKSCGMRVAPALNRCVIFRTNETSYHGVRPITAPAGVERKSFAAYYYTREAPVGWNGQTHSTIFRARPDERLRGLLLMPADKLKREAVARWKGLKKRAKRLLGVGEQRR